MKCIWQEDAYCSPVFLFKANVQEKTLAENNVALKEAKCRVNTWSWVIYNSKEAEVHFLLADDIIAAVRVIVLMFTFYLSIDFRLDMAGKLAFHVQTSLWSALILNQCNIF